ncbi:triacylglycerol lipase [Fusarium proliferatum]|uniref:Triacylglycerol lipase n=1 Tax=Gibberella intermedia TaxID=948311 RepID=A0A365MT03_GIBIN|nr:triacylglycerol lipase [Fusarium proliferatum]KAG4284706.1 triacylglycerol lipase [Fusarium proliferatum]RBA11670.1 triacylglycerol lipase [Fusarium proliferatum]
MRLRPVNTMRTLTLQLVLITSCLALSNPFSILRHSSNGPCIKPYGISVPLFATLERLSRLVDIAYCIGTTGVRKPFDCVSRCSEFPSLDLINTWNTGPLLSDSCGYIAVDHGVRQRGDNDAYMAGEPAIVVAFRGTYSIANTIVDLSTVPQEYVPYPSPDHDGENPPDEPKHQWEIYIAKKELSPSEADIYMCTGDNDPKCISGADDSLWMTIRRLFHVKGLLTASDKLAELNGFPSRFKLWQLLFAHRDYFWRLGLCVPGGDPADWGRGRYQAPETEEL